MSHRFENIIFRKRNIPKIINGKKLITILGTLFCMCYFCHTRMNIMMKFQKLFTLKIDWLQIVFLNSYFTNHNSFLISKVTEIIGKMAWKGSSRSEINLQKHSIKKIYIFQYSCIILKYYLFNRTQINSTEIYVYVFIYLFIGVDAFWGWP